MLAIRQLEVEWLLTGTPNKDVFKIGRSPTPGLDGSFGIESRLVNPGSCSGFPCSAQNLKEHKAVDISTLPPCESVLWFHCLRSNMVAKLWKSSQTAVIDEPDISECGWYDKGEIRWLHDPFPRDIELLF